MKLKIVIKVALVFALFFSEGAINAQNYELPVFSACSSVKGILEKSLFFTMDQRKYGDLQKMRMEIRSQPSLKDK